MAKAPTLAEANIAALNAGHAYGETAELAGPLKQHHVDPAPVALPQTLHYATTHNTYSVARYVRELVELLKGGDGDPQLGARLATMQALAQELKSRAAEPGSGGTS